MNNSDHYEMIKLFFNTKHDIYLENYITLYRILNHKFRKFFNLIIENV